ncbi:MAG: hypothetical protein P9M13_03810 [Candidatus Ancaeobacter aquaticus]|nr:hypothetical protein [Candidatus Ancaeobacter aquaticus]
MALCLYFRPSFQRSIKHLGYEQKKIVGLILETLNVYYSIDCNLLEARKIAPRFFYKQLRRPYYEAGIESNIRVVIRREKEKCIAVLAGSHDQIKQFLSNIF